MQTIDTRGMSCPQPVLMAKKALEAHPEGIDVIAGDNTAKNNIKRFMESSGYSVQLAEDGNDFVLKARK